MPLLIKQGGCSCAKGLGEGCGHVAALLYQLADFKARGLKAVPSDVAKTSIAQQFHQPRGSSIKGDEIQHLSAKGYAPKTALSQSERKGIQSTLYNPVRGDLPNMATLADSLEEVAPSFMIIPALKQTSNTSQVRTKFGDFPFGSAIAIQQRLHSDFQLNVFDSVEFPTLPTDNKMINNYSHVLTQVESVMLDDLNVTPSQATSIETETRLQSNTALWHKVREKRITASKAHLVYRRQRNHETLVSQLKKKGIQTQAMREGLEDEPKAAMAYGEVIDKKGNILPCGIVVSPWACWLAASPDRKVYRPDRVQPFGLLEIKCPRKDSVLECKYLKPIPGGLLLDRKHEYYTQVQAQLAVTGLPWCDFFVWNKNDHHLETIYFDPAFWQDVKDEIDVFYFTYYIKM